MSEADHHDLDLHGTTVDATTERVAAQVDQQGQVLGNQIEEAMQQMAYLTEALASHRRSSDGSAESGATTAEWGRHDAGWLATVLDSILSGVIVIDPQTHTIVDVNDAAGRLIGLPKDQIIGQVCHRFICPAEQGQCAITDLHQEVDLSERVLLTGQGVKVPVIKTVMEAQWRGRHYLVESLIDVSGWKQAQQRQQDLVQKMENANRELTEFAYVVSHDLRAPLRGIKTLASWIAADSAAKLDAEGQEQLSLLLSRVGRMEDLINGILQYSRAGRPSDEDQGVVDLGEVLPSIIDMLAPPPHIAITIESALPQVHVDRTRIGQLFQNLISNAVKFMDKPQGQIRIRCTEDAEVWRFSVADNGPGIEEKYFQKIFKLFQTLAPRDECESSGVGLAVVKKIATFYGGQVWVESRVGEGSTFFFTLSKAQVSVHADQPSATAPA
jgi:two-component system sensor kinase FixL